MRAKYIAFGLATILPLVALVFTLAGAQPATAVSQLSSLQSSMDDAQAVSIRRPPVNLSRGLDDGPTIDRTTL